MKKVLFVLLSAAALQVNAQAVKTATSFPDCPVGYCPSVSMTIAIPNFHKPRTMCTSGFGICVQVNVSAACNPCTGKPAVSGDKATMLVKLSEQYAECHIPAALKTQKGFEKTDFTKFEIDDNTLSFKSASGVVKTVKGGVYSVTSVSDELVVMLSLN